MSGGSGGDCGVVVVVCRVVVMVVCRVVVVCRLVLVVLVVVSVVCNPNTGGWLPFITWCPPGT